MTIKSKFAAFFALCVACALISCKKETKPRVTPSDILLPISGKWMETKLRCYSIDINSNVVSDTTYSSSAFTAKDFFWADKDSSCVISADYVFNGFSKGYPISNAASIAPGSFNYYFAGPYEYGLENPRPAITAKNLYGITITTPDANTVLVHTVYISGDGAPTPNNFPYYRTLSDAYYTR
jgi:hypothetical protein